MQDDEIRSIAEQKNLLILMSAQQEMPEVKYYINLKELQRPEEILGVYTYSPPEGLTKLGFNVVLPSATYEFVSGEEASKYNITLSARNRTLYARSSTTRTQLSELAGTIQQL